MKIDRRSENCCFLPFHQFDERLISSCRDTN